jgi:hypothetical protein
MKFIKVTHIDTAGHGYLSVSKKDFLAVGGDPAKISKYSGHTFTRLYLEEDSDASYFADLAKTNDFNLVVKSSYNPKFAITHNYNPELFDFKPEIGKKITFHNDDKAQIILIPGVEGQTATEGILVLMVTGNHKGRQYRIPTGNPFAYIAGKA